MTDHVLKRCATQAPICMVVSEQEAIAVAKSLLSLRWECLDEAALVEKLSPMQHHLPEVPDFEERFNRALTKILELPKVYISVCAACQKSPEKLMRCAQCKEVQCCDVACQRNDWKTHKQSCQKVKVLL